MPLGRWNECAFVAEARSTPAVSPRRGRAVARMTRRNAVGRATRPVASREARSHRAVTKFYSFVSCSPAGALQRPARGLPKNAIRRSQRRRPREVARVTKADAVELLEPR